MSSETSNNGAAYASMPTLVKQAKIEESMPSAAPPPMMPGSVPYGNYQGLYGGQMVSSPTLYGYPQMGWPGSSPAMSNLGLSPGSPTMHQTVPFPDSPPLFDAAQMLMSPGRFKRRPQYTSMISGYGVADGGSPTLDSLVKKAPILKVPMSPSSIPSLSSPRQRPASLVLPFSLNNSNEIVVQGPASFNGTNRNDYWEEAYRNAQRLLCEVEAIDEENITIIEIKQMLRRYGGNATGKKELLIQRLKTMARHAKKLQEAGSFDCLVPDEPVSILERWKAPLLSANLPKTESAKNDCGSNDEGREDGEIKEETIPNSSDNLKAVESAVEENCDSQKA